MKDRIHRRHRNPEDHHHRDPERRRRRGDQQGRARLLAAGAHPGLPSRQGAADGRQAALPRADPARRDAHADSEGGRRGAAGARHRAGRHAEHQGRRSQGRPAAEVHGGDRDRAAVRSRRSVDALAAAAADGDHRRGRGADAGASARARRQVRAGRGTTGRRCRHGRHRHRTEGSATAKPTRTRTSVSSSARPSIRRASTRS